MGRTVLTAVLAVAMLGGCASAPPTEAPLPGHWQDSLINASQAMVAVTVGNCTSRHGPIRTQRVTVGRVAVFEAVQTADFVLKVVPLQIEQGKMFIALTAKWESRSGATNVFSRHMLTQDGETSPETVLSLDGYESCFTVKAQSSPAL